jgi:3-polyprenyl-4-hydroxybenzoate decarboxylase
MGINATNKIGSETDRVWGRIAKTDKATKKQIETIATELNL